MQDTLAAARPSARATIRYLVNNINNSVDPKEALKSPDLERCLFVKFKKIPEISHVIFLDIAISRKLRLF